MVWLQNTMVNTKEKQKTTDKEKIHKYKDKICKGIKTETERQRHK